eukprot:TRINITY_DN3978_c2_g3_i3.p3 TRINITY_DN3978_c2_g3~~TRINITY_DN3978_c2_g3_i3.p3  ORF type:complete len:183 (+),score=5.84 TRINITY_DN3978_c2_g3_i3:1011-1559(+)
MIDYFEGQVSFGVGRITEIFSLFQMQVLFAQKFLLFKLLLLNLFLAMQVGRCRGGYYVFWFSSIFFDALQRGGIVSQGCKWGVSFSGSFPHCQFLRSSVQVIFCKDDRLEQFCWFRYNKMQYFDIRKCNTLNICGLVLLQVSVCGESFCFLWQFCGNYWWQQIQQANKFTCSLYFIMIWGEV